MHVQNHCICTLSLSHTKMKIYFSPYSLFLIPLYSYLLLIEISRLLCRRSSKSTENCLITFNELKSEILEYSTYWICHVEASTLFAYQAVGVRVKRCNYVDATDTRANECNCRDDRCIIPPV